MDPQKRKKQIIGIALGSVVLVATALLLAWWLGSRAPANVESGITQVTFSRSAYDVALARALSWQSDAALMTMATVDTTGQRWNFTFVSLKAKGKALTVIMEGQSVVSADEIAFSGQGQVLPQNVISPDQAILAAHAVRGYATSTIESLQLIYNAAAKQWYWGMKTNKNVTVTVKATP